MEVYPTTVSSGTAANPAAGAGYEDLSREDFLLLLMTQLKYQDPLEPMDDQALLTQFTQLNSLEELQGINEKMETSVNESITDAAILIGKEVQVSPDGYETIEGTVSSVSLFGDEVMLSIDGVSYPISSLVYVENPEE